MLKLLKSKIQADLITTLAKIGFNAKSNKNAQRAVLYRFASKLGTYANTVITDFTRNVLTSL